MRSLMHQIVKFGLVGVVAFLIDYVFLYIFTEWCGIHYFISASLSFCISVVFNYFASILWVFKVNKSKEQRLVFAIFIFLSFAGLCLNQVMMWLGVELIDLHYLVVKIVATAVVMVFNFVTRKMFLEE